MPAVCTADSGAFAQRWCAGLDSEIAFSLMKNSVARACAHRDLDAQAAAVVSFSTSPPFSPLRQELR